MEEVFKKFQSLDDFFMQDDDADHYEESRTLSPDLPYEFPDSQPSYEEYRLSKSRIFPKEIPDSQEDPRDYDFDNDLQEGTPEADFDDDAVPLDEVDFNQSRLQGAVSANNVHKSTVSHIDNVEFEGAQLFRFTSFNTEATEIVEGGTRLPKKPHHRFPLHNTGYDTNGRLPCEAPQYQGVMDEEPTQPNTQPYHDPRRHGTNSMLCEQDETDIIAVLHPASPSAHLAVSLTAEAAAQHILQNHPLSHIPEEGDSRELSELSDVHGSARDIALRFSSKVHDIRLGFYFGRNPSNSDIILGGPPHKTISSRQFRIFLNHHGILMLEDTSTNGTIVDGMVLRGNRSTDHSGKSQPKMTLHQGAMIEIPTTTKENGELIRFVVNIPQRDNGQTRYNQNLNGYLQCVFQAERRAAALEKARKAGAEAAEAFPAPMNALPPGIRQEVTPNASAYLATTGGNTHGMHWNGGTKYNVVSLLGSGAMANVFKLSSKRDGEVFACKQLDKKRFLRSGIVGDKIYNELNIIKRLRHPYIVQCTDQHETEAYIYIIMELVPNGDLGAYTTAGKVMPEHEAVVVARQMIEAMDYLHANGITHRDIKPENILVAAPFPWIFKLSDFGLAKVVKNDETFLRTFCGTLLYLAPEVHPGYARVKSGMPPNNNTKRARDGPPVETRPYRHSVDIWSLGAVLYQLLAAKPAWSGTSANNGELFLVTVMTIPVDYERLIMIGNSSEAANFISRMLVLEPGMRAREAELKAHRWLIPKPDPMDPDATIDEPVELDASQLSLADHNIEQEVDLEYDDDQDVEDLTADPRDPKRSRPTHWAGDEDEDLPDLYGNRAVDRAQHVPRSYFHYDMEQSLPDMSGPPPPRLFGEIGSSALRSSGVLGQNANAALEFSTAESNDDGYADASFQKFLGGVSENANPDYPEIAGTTLNTPNEGTTQQNIQYPQILSNPSAYSGAPSLLGAEALVGKLNMASTGSVGSVDSKPTSPRTPADREFSPASTTSKRPSQSIDSAQEEPETKRSKTKRTSSSPRAAQRSVGLPADHGSSASKSSGKTAVDDATARKEDSLAGVNDSNERLGGVIIDGHNPVSKANGKARAEAVPGKEDASAGAKSDDNHDGQYYRGPGKMNAPPPNSTSKSQHSARNSNVGSNVGDTVTSQTLTSNRQPSIRGPLTPSLDLAPPPIPSEDGFFKPNICKFGTLFPTRGSVDTVKRIKISSMGTTFGRASENKYVHPNPSELRVPKNAIDLQLWYPGMEKDLAAGIDWTLNPALSCFISTRTSRYIKVNGVRLMKGKDCWLYGKLKSGDTISVFELAEGQEAKSKADTEYLRFYCEFNIGGSKSHRKDPKDQFVVHKEKEKFHGSLKEDAKREKSIVAGSSASAAATMISGGQASMTGGHTTAGASATTGTAPTTKAITGERSSTTAAS